MPQTEQSTYFNYKITDAQGVEKIERYNTEKQYEKDKLEAAKIGSTIEVLKQQTFIVTLPESDEDFKQLVRNDEARLDMSRYGCSVAQTNIRRTLMNDDTWDEQEGAYDLINDVQEPKQGRVADPASKTKRNLIALFKKLNPAAPEPSADDVEKALELMLQSMAAAAAVGQ
jgi:hypothetical protein